MGLFPYICRQREEWHTGVCSLELSLAFPCGTGAANADKTLRKTSETNEGGVDSTPSALEVRYDTRSIDSFPSTPFVRDDAPFGTGFRALADSIQYATGGKQQGLLLHRIGALVSMFPANPILQQIGTGQHLFNCL